MNETRKKIIELIEPYMDKILSEGCLIKVPTYQEKGGHPLLDTSIFYSFDMCEYGRIKLTDNVKLESFYISDGCIKLISTHRNTMRCSPNLLGGEGDDLYNNIRGAIIEFAKKNKFGFKILGHYDITAVLKYINSFGLFVGYKQEPLGFCIEKKDTTLLGYISCKPLHLYTEEKDKKLLSILLKIKNDTETRST